MICDVCCSHLREWRYSPRSKYLEATTYGTCSNCGSFAFVSYGSRTATETVVFPTETVAVLAGDGVRVVRGLRRAWMLAPPSIFWWRSNLGLFVDGMVTGKLVYEVMPRLSYDECCALAFDAAQRRAA